MCSLTRRTFIRSAAAAPTMAALSHHFQASVGAEGASRRRLADAGWCWDGQGFNGGVNPSIFGAGEGTKWFGLKKTAYMFHPNTELAMEKLRDFDEVIC